MAIHNPTHRELDWLLRNVLLTHDYTVVIRQSMHPHEENHPQRENRC